MDRRGYANARLCGHSSAFQRGLTFLSAEVWDPCAPSQNISA
jgi:hypothetical protein